MNKSDGTGFDWPVFFNLAEDKGSVIDWIRRFTDADPCQWESYKGYFVIKSLNGDGRFYRDEFRCDACRIELLRFCVELSDFARDLVGDEDAAKCRNQFERGQYDSNLLKYVLSGFLCFLCKTGDAEAKVPKITGAIEASVARTAGELRLSRYRKKLMPLKTAVDRFAPGVDWDCYLDALDRNRDRYRHRGYYKIPDELNDHVKERFGYDYNSIHENGLFSLFFLGEPREQISPILRHVMLPDSGCWEDPVLEGFNALEFIGSVFERNGGNLANKVLDHIFSTIAEKDYGRRMLENSVPLTFLDRESFCDAMERHTFNFAFGRFGAKYDLEKLDASGLCYPFAGPENAEEKIAEGKGLFEDALRKTYRDDYDEVTGFIRGEVRAPSRLVSGDADWTMRTVLDIDTFGYHKDIDDRKAVAAYCPDYFSEENIWARVYLKTYFMHEIPGGGDRYAENLFEDIYDMSQFVEECIGVKTAYERDVSGRDEAFAGLRKLLKGYGAEISDKFKGDYVISLLDRKVAVRDESLRFPVLEQTGDAVYGFALAEMLFYDPEKDEEEIREIHQEMVAAKYQIEIAKKIGTDRLYLSPFTISVKYDHDTPFNADTEAFALREEGESYSDSDKYIADSLEMIIGAIYEDLGYQAAIGFTKRILRETFPDRFGSEIRWDDWEKDKDRSEVDLDYWARVLPAPYSEFEHSSEGTMWHAFDKLFMVMALGTDEKANRDAITYHIGDPGVYDDTPGSAYTVDKVFFEYLRNGLDSAVEKYGAAVAENFKKQ